MFSVLIYCTGDVEPEADLGPAPVVPSDVPAQPSTEFREETVAEVQRRGTHDLVPSHASEMKAKVLSSNTY